MIIQNRDGRRFLVRVVEKGDRYGLDDCLTHDEADPLIEFYDLTYTEKFGPRGQFVSRYYASTLAEDAKPYSLTLDGGVPVWWVDAEALAPVLKLARRIAIKCPVCHAPSEKDRFGLTLYCDECARSRPKEGDERDGPFES